MLFLHPRERGKQKKPSYPKNEKPFKVQTKMPMVPTKFPNKKKKKNTARSCMPQKKKIKPSPDLHMVL